MRLLNDNGKEAGSGCMFLAHWVEPWNWLLKWKLFGFLHRQPGRSWLVKPLLPVYLFFSWLYRFSRQPYDAVDRFQFGGVKSETWLLRNFAWHYVTLRLPLPFFKVTLKNRRDQMRRRVIAAVSDAAKADFSVVGLGALTKDQKLTDGGQLVVAELEDLLKQTGTRVVHGDTLTAAAVVYRTLQAIRFYKLEGKPVFVTGATSKIGRAITLALARNGVTVYQLTDSRERSAEIRAESGSWAKHIKHVADMAEGADCPLWITGKADPGAGKKIIRHVPKYGAVINFSVPDPLTPALLKRRPDISHIDGGLMGYNPEETNLRFTMRLVPGITYACHAATITHARMLENGCSGWGDHEVDQVEMSRMDLVWQAAGALGFSMPPPTSFLKPLLLSLPLIEEVTFWQKVNPLILLVAESRSG